MTNLAMTGNTRQEGCMPADNVPLSMEGSVENTFNFSLGSRKAF